MVYRGRPFRGCLPCKVRKLKVNLYWNSEGSILLIQSDRRKCDQGESGCRQCAKSQLQCMGFEAGDNALSEDNEGCKTSTVIRHTGQRTTKTRIRSPSRIKYRSLMPQKRYSVSPYPQQSVQCLALHHFLFNYVYVSQQQSSSTPGSFDFVLPLLHAAPNSPFKDALTAAALALFNNRVVHSKEIDVQMTYFYSQALKGICSALGESLQLKDDSTLASVLMLGLVENISGRHSSWQWHIYGAAKLIVLRGPEQLHTKIGLDLFLAAQVRMVCFAFPYCQWILIVSD